MKPEGEYIKLQNEISRSVYASIIYQVAPNDNFIVSLNAITYCRLTRLNALMIRFLYDLHKRGVKYSRKIALCMELMREVENTQTYYLPKSFQKNKGKTLKELNRYLFMLMEKGKFAQRYAKYRQYVSDSGLGEYWAYLERRGWKIQI